MDSKAARSLSSPGALAQIPGDVSFRNGSVNAIALVPLLSSTESTDGTASRSSQSFQELMDAIHRHTGHSTASDSDSLLVVSNSSLTRPGDWRYSETPLKIFHWLHGCQRIRLFDGRPEHSRQAHDRLLNRAVTKDWIDLCPWRRTAAVVGVLNVHDCKDLSDLHKAEEELKQWTERYATHPYEVSAYGKSGDRDLPVQRLFVYDSFDEECQKIDLTKSKLGSALVAFPPSDKAHTQMMDLHLNVVINDLVVAIFLELEKKIKESDAICSSISVPTPSRRPFKRIISSQEKEVPEEEPQSPSNLTVGSLAGLVSGTNILGEGDSAAAASSGATTSDKSSFSFDAGEGGTGSTVLGGERNVSKHSSTALLLTPLDEYWEASELTTKDIENIRRRDAGRREKFSADLSLLAGSPLDAYQRYLKAAELCKTGTLDPLWYAASLEGCATAHIAMAEAGGHGVDEYLENNFSLPASFLAATIKGSKEERPSARQVLPDIILALCEEALNIVNRHIKLSAFHAELLVKLAFYMSESAEAHVRCRWGEGNGCYGGEVGETSRWELASAFKIAYDESARNPAPEQTFERTQKVCEFLHRAVSLSALDTGTRVEVARQAVKLCLHGIKPTKWADALSTRVQLPRKAAFFATVAADAACGRVAKNEASLWLLAVELYSKTEGNTYGWGCLRAACLSALATKGDPVISTEASEQLLSLLGELKPQTQPHVSSDERGLEDNSTDIADPADDLAELNREKGLEAAQGLSTTANYFAKQLRDRYNSITSSSALLTQQAKWAYDEPVALLNVPLGENSSLSTTVTTLKCVWDNSDQNRCYSAQSSCINRLTMLRRAQATPSLFSVDFPLLYGGDSLSYPPLYLVATSVIESESNVGIEKEDLNKAGNEERKGSMATFFNPFDNKKKADTGKTSICTINGEERMISVTFRNRLTVALEVAGCRLDFTGDDLSRFRCTSVRFVVPAGSAEFTVKLPFTIISDMSDTEQNMEVTRYRLKGVTLTCLGRAFSLPIPLHGDNPRIFRNSIPIPVSQYKTKNSKKQRILHETIEVESYPYQPRLAILLGESGKPVSDLTAELMTGALYSSPKLTMEFHGGSSSCSAIKSLQIFVGGIPGLNQLLFDSEGEDILGAISDAEFLNDGLMSSAPSGLKARVVVDDLNLGKSGISALRLQLLAQYEFHRKLGAEAKLWFRFRYRIEPMSSFQIWRSRDVHVHVKSVTGPSITSISFQSQLHNHFLGKDQRETMDVLNLKSSQKEFFGESNYLSSILYEVGRYSSTNLIGERFDAILTVANNSSHLLKLSTKNIPMGGLGMLPISGMDLLPSVSVRIPVNIRRHTCESEKVDVDSIVSDLTLSTLIMFQFKDIQGGSTLGQLRVKQSKLADLIRSKPSILPKLCDPPCTISFVANGSTPTGTPISSGLGGSGLQICVEFRIADWLGCEKSDDCDVISLLNCARDTDPGDAPSSSGFMWAGKQISKVTLSPGTYKHEARILFSSPGSYVVSACAEFKRKGSAVEERWWSPVSQKIVVAS